MDIEYPRRYWRKLHVIIRGKEQGKKRVMVSQVLEDAKGCCYSHAHFQEGWSL